MALDERHPAFRQIRDLALALHNKFPVPIVTRDKEQPYDPKDVPQTVFHTRVRARTICLIGATREIEITKIAPLLGASAIVEEDVQDLKTIGLVSIRYEGRSAFVSLNRDFFAYAELKALVDRLTSIYPEYQKMVEIYASGKSPQAKRTRKRRKTRKR